MANFSEYMEKSLKLQIELAALLTAFEPCRKCKAIRCHREDFGLLPDKVRAVSNALSKIVEEVEAKGK